ncbi:unnamed protein product [Orchesella dallaii]|uniref:Chitin-binding type-2 domain-containing protein n=1 Tax=Orchesella dallaii TaxID=48710 RepID=A0ABP1Q9P3_9HEXA
MFKMAIKGVFLLSITFCLTVSLADGKQLIRLRNGMECPMPGHFRDVQNCRKFYYCPAPGSHIYEAQSHKQEELDKILGAGLMCPEGSIFDESIGVNACNNLDFVKVIPPECLESSYHSTSSAINSGSLHEITTNN